LLFITHTHTHTHTHNKRDLRSPLPTQESHEKEVQIQEANPEAFAKVLEYLYTKDLNVVGQTMPRDLLTNTFDLANRYNVDPLKLKLETILGTN